MWKQRIRSNQTVDTNLGIGNEASSWEGAIIALVVVLIPFCIWLYAYRRSQAVLDEVDFHNGDARLSTQGSRMSGIGLEMEPVRAVDEDEDGDESDTARLALQHTDSVRSRSQSSVVEFNVATTLSWCKLSYTVETASWWERIQGASQPKTILNDVSGYCVPGTVTAIMGPSGSGKTTMLNLLAGRTKAGEMAGLRMINGVPLAARPYKLKMAYQGYVLQTDHFFPDLTVREMLFYSALLRLPENATSSLDKMARVDEVLSEVELHKASGAIIGGQGSGIDGISGGQRRRLSMATELLSNPAVLILDEPTSGLDATTSHNIVSLVHNLAKATQRTVLLTIHQPRPESFQSS